nr:hypothetical protein Itr_chr06CG14550 [Ipomoea trifida]
MIRLKRLNRCFGAILVKKLGFTVGLCGINTDEFCIIRGRKRGVFEPGFRRWCADCHGCRQQQFHLGGDQIQFCGIFNWQQQHITAQLLSFSLYYCNVICDNLLKGCFVN